MLRMFVAALAAIFMSACVTSRSQAAVFTATKGRTVYVIGEIGANALDMARQVVDLAAADPKAPIDMVISSPGGSIVAGMQLLSAMTVAQTRGVTIRCFVPLLAASMAFQVFAACDERYTLEFSLLLWHPGALSGERLTAGDLEYNAEQLRAMERVLNARLIKALGMPEDVFYYHYFHETLWFASELNRQAPGFLTIVQDFQNVPNPFPAAEPQGLE
jgi:ATP-dependent protease ClpP protease subunit